MQRRWGEVESKSQGCRSRVKCGRNSRPEKEREDPPLPLTGFPKEVAVRSRGNGKDGWAPTAGLRQTVRLGSAQELGGPSDAGPGSQCRVERTLDHNVYCPPSTGDRADREGTSEVAPPPV